MRSRSKILLYQSRRVPNANPLDICLTSTLFDDDVSLFFHLDSVYQLKTEKAYQGIQQYDIPNFYVHKEGMLQRKLSNKDLLVEAQPIDSKSMQSFYHSFDKIIQIL